MIDFFFFFKSAFKWTHVIQTRVVLVSTSYDFKRYALIN